MATTDETNPLISGPAPIRYRLALGAGWQRIRLDENAGADVKAYLDTVFGAVPSGTAESARALIETRLTTQIMAGRAKGGIDFYVPAPKPGAGPLPALTIVAAEVRVPTTAVPEPAEIVARVAGANPTARTGVVGGMPAVRIERSGDQEVHIEYVQPVAGDTEHRWLSLALSGQAGPGGDDSQIAAAVAAFDRAVAELAWE